MLSIIFHVSNIFVLPGIPFALYSSTYKIGFPGWPEPILDSVTGFGASITKRGLAPAPFFISTALPPTPGLGRSNMTTADSQEGHQTPPFLRKVNSTAKNKLGSGRTASAAAIHFFPENLQRGTVRQKNERPRGGGRSGVGMEGTVIRSQFGFSSRSAALASSRTTHKSRQVTTVGLLQKAKQLPTTCPVSRPQNLSSIAR